MTEPSVAKAPEKQIKQRQTRGRSPGYPFISLEKALERAYQLKEREGFYAAPLSSVYAAFGISEKSSSSPQVVAAVKHFGLIEYEGVGKDKKIKLTDLARNIILDVDPDSVERPKLIKAAALTPPIHLELLQMYPDGLPSDATLQTFLARDRGFNEGGAKALISQFKDTIAFAKVGAPDIIPSNPPAEDSAETPSSEEIKVGDLIQIEINGAFTLEKPKVVRAIQEHNGFDYVFIEGEKVGFPMEQAALQTPKATIIPPVVSPPVLELPQEQTPLGVREEKVSLDEGPVVLRWPETLSAESVVDFEYWVTGMIRRAKRRAGMDDDKSK